MSDPNFSSVSLLLHCDGVNGSTSVIDSGPSPHTVTAFGDAKISTANSKFGGASLKFDGVGDRVSTPSNADWSFDAGDFTIEAFVYCDTDADGEVLACRDSGAVFWFLRRNAGGGIRFYAKSSGFSIATDVTTTQTVSINTWMHLAVVRLSGTVAVYIDGSAATLTGTNLADAYGTTTDSLHIGSGDSTSSYWSGYLDEIRITKGVARYTANFTAPTAAFSMLDPIYEFTGLPYPTITEGGAGATYWLTTTNVLDTETLYYSIDGAFSAPDFVTGLLTGELTLFSPGVRTVTVQASFDSDIEGPTPFTLSIHTGSPTGPTVATSPTCTVLDGFHDTVVTGLRVSSCDIYRGGPPLIVYLDMPGIYDGGGNLFWFMTGASSGDFVEGITTSPMTVSGGHATIQLTPTGSGGTKTFKIGIYESPYNTLHAITPVITLTDAVVSQSVAIAVDSTHIYKGDTVTATLTTTGLADGSLLWWQIVSDPLYPAMVREDWTDLLLGFFTTVTGGSASIVHTAITDTVPEYKKFQYQIKKQGDAGNVLATSDWVTYQYGPDPITGILSLDKTSIHRGLVGVTASLSGINRADGTTLYWSTSQTGGLTGADFTDAALTGSFTVTGGIGSVVRSAVNDFLTHGPQSFQLLFRETSTAGPIFAYSGMVSVTSGSSDTHFTDVALLVPGDGSSGSTAVLDLSQYNRSFDVVPSAYISTTTKKFGTGSLENVVYGVGARTVNDSTLNLGAGDFCVEGWMFSTNTGQFETLADTTEGSPAGNWFFGVNTNAGRSLVVNLAGVAHQSIVDGGMPTNRWNFVTWVRVSGANILFCDGCEVLRWHDSVDHASTGHLVVGKQYAGSGPVFIDDLRVTVGVSRYSGNFVPPQQAFPGASTILGPDPDTNTYTITPNTLALVKGDPFIATIATTGVSDITQLFWEILGTARSVDFADSLISGSFFVTFGAATITKATNVTSGDCFFTFRIKTVSASGRVAAVTQVVRLTNPSSPPTDPYWDNVVLLHHYEHSNDGTVPHDSSASNKTTVVTTDAHQGATPPKWGDYAAYSSAGHFILAPYADFLFGTADFTVEFWWNTPNSIGGTAPHTIVDTRFSGHPGFALEDNSQHLSYVSGATVLATGSAAVSDSAWHHIAIVRHAGVITVYVEGVVNLTCSDATDYVGGTGGLSIYSDSVGAHWAAGFIDELRVTKDVARYLAPFTPPTGPFPEVLPAPPVNVSYAIAGTPNYDNVGTVYDFNITTTGVADGTVLYWTAWGSAIGDFFADGLMSGSTTITSNAGVIHRTSFDPGNHLGGDANFKLDLRLSGVLTDLILVSSDYVTIHFPPDVGVCPDQSPMYYWQSNGYDVGVPRVWASPAEYLSHWQVNYGHGYVTSPVPLPIVVSQQYETNVYLDQWDYWNSSFYVQAYGINHTDYFVTPDGATAERGYKVYEGGLPVIFSITLEKVVTSTDLEILWKVEGAVTAADFEEGVISGTILRSSASAGYSIDGIGQTNITLTPKSNLVLTDDRSFWVTLHRSHLTCAPVATSSIITLVNTTIPALTYALDVDHISINEGETATFTVTTSLVDDGTTLYWDAVGTAASNDFVDAAMTGSVVIASNSASIPRLTVTDSVYEGNRNFNLNLRTGSNTGPIKATSPLVVIVDTSVPPVTVKTYTIHANKTTINEGETVTFTVGTVNVPNGTVLYWTEQGTAAAVDFTDGQVSGSFTILAGSATILRTATPDLLTEGNDTFQIVVREASILGTPVATSETVTILDTSTSPTVTPTIEIVVDKAVIYEGETVKATVTCSNMGDYGDFTLFWTTNGTAYAADFADGVVGGSFVMQMGTPYQGLIYRTASLDTVPEPPRTFVIDVRFGSVIGTVLATSIVITILDGQVAPPVSDEYFCDNNPYVMLIPNNNNAQPNFRAVICLETKPFVDIGVQANALVPVYFDLDLATGSQLDVIGEWVGLSRRLDVVLDNVYFSWNDIDPYKGWDLGKWRGLYENEQGSVTLADDQYRSLIRAKILANHWDGTITQAAMIWALALPNGQSVTIKDNQDMTMTTTIGSTPTLTATEIAIIQSGFFDLKPVGVTNIIVGVPTH